MINKGEMPDIKKFELIYAFYVSKRQRQATMRAVKETREEIWKEAMEKANGDTKKAYSIYEKICTI